MPEITRACREALVRSWDGLKNCQTDEGGIFLKNQIRRPDDGQIHQDPMGNQSRGIIRNPDIAKEIFGQVIETGADNDMMTIKLFDNKFNDIVLEAPEGIANSITEEGYYKLKNKKYINQNGIYINDDNNPYEGGEYIKVLAGIFYSENSFDTLVLYQPAISNIQDIDILTINSIIDSLNSQGYICRNPRILIQFLMALWTNQIIVLHGKPGAGKTSFSNAIANVLNGKHFNLQVRPNWVDNQDLVGFYNPVEKMYYSTPFLDILVEASNNPSTPYFITLDEMNLAYIEQYFSDVLSAMEIKDRIIHLYSTEEKERLMKRYNQLVPDGNIDELIEAQTSYEDKMRLMDLKDCYDNMKMYPPDFVLPKNVQFIGTLNMDATTKELSPKIIDRSFLIDFGGEAILNIDDIFDEEQAIGDINPVDDIQIYDSLKEHFNVEMSNRALKQFEDMQNICKNNSLKHLKKEVFIDLFVSSKILPMIKTEGIEKFNLPEDFEEGSYPFTCEKIERMFRETDSKKGSYNYWRM